MNKTEKKILNNLINSDDKYSFNVRNIDFNFPIQTKTIFKIINEIKDKTEYLEASKDFVSLLENRNECDKELISSFLKINNFFDIYNLLYSNYGQYGDIASFINILKNSSYNKFYIPKKSGGSREIYSPEPVLKIIQKRICFILNRIYKFKKSAHGFVLNKNIKTNASEHISKVQVLNIDLKNFFPSINFGRVRGVFLQKPFCFNEKTATILTRICCHNNFLPQGAPTSPIISNFVCRSLDSKLTILAENNSCFYTRYADDITFSFPYIVKDEFVKEVRKIINKENFKINEKKFRILGKGSRQEVTGLIVNKKVNVKREYIREVRTILYDIEKNGLNNAFSRFKLKYKKYTLIETTVFLNILEGKIDFIGNIRGKDDKLYLKYKNNFDLLISKGNKIKEEEKNRKRKEQNKNLIHDPENFVKALKKFSDKSYSLNKLVHTPYSPTDEKINDIIKKAKKEYREIKKYIPYQSNYIYTELFKLYDDYKGDRDFHPLLDVEFRKEIKKIRKKYRFGNEDSKTNIYDLLSDFIPRSNRNNFYLDENLKNFYFYNDVDKIIYGIKTILENIMEYKKVNITFKDNVIEIKTHLGSTLPLNKMIQKFENYEGDISSLRDKNNKSGHLFSRCDWIIEAYFEENKKFYRIKVLDMNYPDLKIPTPTKIKIEANEKYFKHLLIFYDP